MDGKTALGASSPANPALHIPEPLSTTRAATSSSHIFIYLLFNPTDVREVTGSVQLSDRRLTDEQLTSLFAYISVRTQFLENLPLSMNDAHIWELLLSVFGGREQM